MTGSAGSIEAPERLGAFTEGSTEPRTRLVKYDVKEVHISLRLRKQLALVQHPPAAWMDATQKGEYHVAQLRVMKCMAAAGLKKIKALTDGKYGIDGVGLFELDLADPIIKAVLRTTQNASLGIERQMAKLDRYMRLFYRATPFTLNAAMHAEDAGIAKIMDEFCKKEIGRAHV
jgi:hypothetical protein